MSITNIHTNTFLYGCHNIKGYEITILIKVSLSSNTIEIIKLIEPSMCLELLSLTHKILILGFENAPRMMKAHYLHIVQLCCCKLKIESGVMVPWINIHWFSSIYPTTL